MLRNPDTANSRPITNTTIQAGTRWIWTRETKAAEISSLSAIGSSSVPTVVICPQRRARYPSRRSVIAATRKMESARNSFGIQTTPCHSMRRSCSTIAATSKGTKKMRRMVSAFGRFIRVPDIQRPILLTRISLDDVASELAPDRFGSFGIDLAPIVVIPAVQDLGALVQQMDGQPFARWNPEPGSRYRIDRQPMVDRSE